MKSIPNLIGSHFPALRFLAAAALAACLAACGGSGGYGGNSAGDNAGNGAASGSMRLALTDAPSCGFDAVNVTVTKVRVNQNAAAADSDAGWTEIVLSPAVRVNLLALNNGILAELGQTPLAVGTYTQLRLVLADNTSATPFANSVVVTGGGETALKTPSGQQSGVKANVNFTVMANQMADFVIDFDACKSVVSAGASGNFLLKPVVRVVPRLTSGIAGYVDASLANGNSGSMVSAQQNGVSIKSTLPDASGKFLLAPIAPGSYTLVFTAAGRTTAVISGVTVTADSVTTVNSAAAPLALPPSPQGNLAGTVSTAVTPIDATVRVLQSLTAAGSIEIVSRPVDSVSGAYNYSVALNAPLVTTFSTGAAGGSLLFVADAAATARYSLEADSAGAIKTVGPLTITSGTLVATNFTFP